MKKGNCYDANGKYFFNHTLDSNFRIAHGTVLGQGSIKGIRHGHCWIENGSIVMDFSNGRQIIMHKGQYYKIGKIKHIKRYNKEQFNKMILKHKNWGPWK